MLYPNSAAKRLALRSLERVARCRASLRLCTLPSAKAKAILAGPAIRVPVSEFAFLKGERRRDKAEAIHRRTDYWDFEGSGASGEHSRGVPPAQPDRADFLSLAQQVRRDGGFRSEEAARALGARLFDRVRVRVLDAVLLEHVPAIRECVEDRGVVAQDSEFSIQIAGLGVPVKASEHCRPVSLAL